MVFKFLFTYRCIVGFSVLYTWVLKCFILSEKHTSALPASVWYVKNVIQSSLYRTL